MLSSILPTSHLLATPVCSSLESTALLWLTLEHLGTVCATPADTPYSNRGPHNFTSFSFVKSVPLTVGTDDHDNPEGCYYLSLPTPATVHGDCLFQGIGILGEN
jgi:hypothetical protein